MIQQRQYSASSSLSLTDSLTRHNQPSVQTSDMAASTATVPNTSSRRTTASSQKNSGKAQSGHSADVKPATDDLGPKRPKRTLKLTASQRERKRAIDREAQRSIRLKTKNYIAHLENLVRIMENGGSTTNIGEAAQSPYQQSTDEQDNERARGLLSQLRQSEEEINKLKDLLSGVQRLVGTSPDPSDEAESNWVLLSNTCNSEKALRMQDHLESCGSVYSHSSGSSSPHVEFGYLPYGQPRSTEVCAQAYPPRSAGPQPFTLQQQDLYNGVGRLSAPGARTDKPTSGSVDAPRIREECELFNLSEREVNRVLAGGHQSFANHPLDDDIVIRAVLHGWRDVQDEYLLDIGWQALRIVDQAIFRECGVVERIAILSMMRLKLLHQSNTNPQYLAPLPPFFQRSSQEDPEALKRIPLIEHIVWPGMRSYACKDPSKYQSNKFADCFRLSVKFLWPFDISDAFVKDYSTQLYSIAPGFKQRQWDLRSWTMRRDFFELASELLGSIPVYEPPMDRTLVSASSIPMQAAGDAEHASQRSQRQIEATKSEEREVGNPQMSMGYDNNRAHVPGSVPTTAPEVSRMQVPYSTEVEAWLGDPDLVPQYWNMSSAMNARYEAAPQQWPSAHSVYGG